ncbi:Leucine-rich repeat protein kinase family protein [Striga hermonthica]|uniref:Leucine-rich repeat protein kinase family protein n=1 Tax=Striga hermonthica TaxID=68872 RepID=A0A9N7R5M3_STRHE|nr:Leucine-rich repeat protein kinase family protein [Striga hermonthica]
MNFTSLGCFVQFFYLFSFLISVTFSLNPDGVSLLALKAAIVKDPTEALISWSDSDSTPCRWDGIICDHAHRRVLSISLPSKNLTGYIPSEIGALTFLTFLDLSQNSFGGPLPHHISALQNLMHLDLSSNNFNGSLPESLSNLTHLSGTLNLSYNSFSGEIPASFGQFPVMVSLDLQHNNLTGKIPLVGSLLNQGPTAFTGNPNLCGFPLINNPCAEPEAQNPRLLNNPQWPENGGLSSNGLAGNRKINSGPVTISVISGVSFVIGVVFISVWVIKKKWKDVEGKLGKENVAIGGGDAVAVRVGCEEGQKGKFVVLDEGFSLELEDLLRASAYVVGKSRSGIVYKVVAGGGGRGVGPVFGRRFPVTAAVRRLCEGESRWRFKEFEAEVEAIGKVQHPNIVRLRAFYFASDDKLLISDFVPNGNLHNALHGGPGNTLPPLSWATRFRIILETSRALTHIHECSPKKHIHGNIKPSKILLDEELKPYISGFGLTRLAPNGSKSTNISSKKLSFSQDIMSTKSSSSSNITTAAYLAPEARAHGSKLTQKCDVYSFGILLLEILTGRAPDREDDNGLEDFVRKVFREERPLSEIIDPSLLHEAHAKKQVVATFHAALSCTERDPELRPKMRVVSDNLDCIKMR